MVVSEIREARTTTVTFTDREIQIIQRALFLDNPTDEPLHQENFVLHGEFYALMERLGLEPLPNRG